MPSQTLEREALFVPGPPCSDGWVAILTGGDCFAICKVAKRYFYSVPLAQCSFLH